MFYWGGTSGTELKVLHGTYRPPHASVRIAEIPILPSTGTDPAVVIQHTGRERKTVSFVARTSSWSGYTTLENDYLAATDRTFVGPHSTAGLNCIIRQLGQPQYVQSAGGARYDFEVVLMEEDT